MNSSFFPWISAALSQVLFTLQLSAFGIYLHAITVAVVIGFSVALLVLEFVGIWRRDEDYLNAAKQIARVIVVAFLFGAASGTIVEFGLVQVWNGVILAIGSFVLIPLYLELTAFILEGGLLLALIYTWGKFKNPWTHWVITALYTFGALLSGALITSVNSWMQAPWGTGELVRLIYPWAPVYGLDAVNPDFLLALKEALVQANLREQTGAVILNPETLDQLTQRYGRLLYDPWVALKNPYAFHSVVHQLLASAIVGISWIAAALAYKALKTRESREYYLKVFKLVAFLAAVLLIVQALAGHGQGVVVYEYQPTKFAMIAGLDVSKPDPIVGLSMFGDPGHVFKGFDYLLEQARNHPNPELKIAGVSAKDIAVRDTLKAMEKLPAVYAMYSAKIGAAGVGILIALTHLSAIVFKRFWKGRERILLYGGLAMAVLMPLVAGLGWAVREIGRKPWTVYGLLYPEELITPVNVSWAAAPILGGLVAGLTLMFITIYFVLKHPPEFLKMGEK